MTRDVISREELLDSYSHPYRRRLPVALKGYGVHYLAGLTALAGAIGWIGSATDADGFTNTVLTIAVLGVFAVVFVAIWVLVVGVRVIRDRTWQWRRDRGDDLALVR